MQKPQHMQKTVFVFLLLQSRAFLFCDGSSELCASLSQASSLPFVEERYSSGSIYQPSSQRCLELFHY